MMILGFTVVFHSAFRVGSAYARDGVDAALDRHDPLPADHVKGLMRAAAASLPVAAALVDQVFGTPARPSPWAWTSASPDGDWDFGRRHRVQIDESTGAASKDRVVLGEQAWAGRARFEVSQVRALDHQAAAAHRLLLRASAAGVHGLGAWRRRGLGWVGLVPDGEPVSADEVDELFALSGGRR
jgi:hypothetical protein